MIINAKCFQEKMDYVAEKHTFSKYLVDESNHFAYSIAKELAAGGWEERSTFIICGALGMGKSHLAHVLMNLLLAWDEERNICHVDGYDYDEDYTLKSSVFLMELDNADALFVMNADVILEGDFNSDTLLIALEHCWKKKKVIVMTMKKSPENLTKRKKEFCEAVNIAKIAKIESPGHNFCVRLIRYWIERDNLEKHEITEDVIDYVAEVGSESIRMLEGAFLKVIASSMIQKQKITIDFAKMVLAELDSRNVQKNLITVCSDMSREDMINRIELPVATYLNLEKKCIEVLDESDYIEKNRVMIPTLDELAPYNAVMYEYVEDMSISFGKSATQYLRENVLLDDFHVYRMQYAVKELEKWFADKCIAIETQ